MRVITDSAALPSAISLPVLTMGTFDGVHRGHQQLLARLREASAERGGTATVLTFRPHPAAVLRPDKAPALIETWARRRELLAKSGVEVLVELDFSRALSEWSARSFVEQLLVKAIGVSHIVAGPDTRFGQGRIGDAALLTQMGSDHGFTVESVGTVSRGGGVVSSSRIRRLIAETGDVEAAADLLGRPFRIVGTVVTGAQRGRTIGFPTANVAPETQLKPATGVYAGWAHHAGGRHAAMINVGYKPTFGELALTTEAYLLDFEGDLYGQSLELDLVHRLRGEQKFAGIDALVAQITADVAAGRALLLP